jgi:hypothetical protein
MLERVSLRYLLAIWVAAAVGRILLAPSMSPASYALLGLLWSLSAVLLVTAIRLLIVAKNAERRVEAFCLGLMMAALLAQGAIGGDDTIGITTSLFFSSLAVLSYVYVRRRLRRGSM